MRQDDWLAVFGEVPVGILEDTRQHVSQVAARNGVLKFTMADMRMGTIDAREEGSILKLLAEAVPMRTSAMPPTHARVGDVLVNNAMYPGIVGIGGNTGTTNSYVGVDTGNLTGGGFNAGSLAEGNNAVCFFLQASQQGMPDVSKVWTLL